MSTGDHIIRMGEFSLDTARACLFRNGQPVHLRPQAYRALKFFAERRGRLVTKEELVREVWDGRAVTDDSLVQCLRDLRQALGSKGSRYFTTRRGLGYIFDFDSTPTADHSLPTSSPSGDRVTATHSETSARSGVRFSRRAGVIAIAMVLSSLVAATMVYQLRARDSAQPLRSVAVLPFVNASGTPELEYLSEGLSEVLMDRLSQLPGVQIIARTSSFRHKSESLEPERTAAALGADALVMGRVGLRDRQLQVRVELVDGLSGTQIWGRQYDRPLSELQIVQNEIAHGISDRLIPGREVQSLPAQTRDATNPEAYRSYLSGLFHRAKRPEDIRVAIDDFQRAVKSDPDFALAWTKLAMASFSLAGDSLAHPAEPLATAKAAALKALELDPTLADAHLILAEIASCEWDWNEAEREYQRALELSPGLVRAYVAYSTHLAMMGRSDEALRVMPLIRRLDPMNERLAGIEGRLLYLARRYDESIERLRQSVDLGNAHSLFWLAAAYDAKQLHHLAMEQYQALIHRLGDNPSNLAFLGYALARAGQREQATAILERVKTTAEYVSPAELAVLYVGLGDRTAAFAALEDAYAVRDLQLGWLKVEQHYDDLRDDPRFRDLERRVGLTPLPSAK